MHKPVPRKTLLHNVAAVVTSATTAKTVVTTATALSATSAPSPDPTATPVPTATHKPTHERKLIATPYKLEQAAAMAMSEDHIVVMYDLPLIWTLWFPEGLTGVRLMSDDERKTLSGDGTFPLMYVENTELILENLVLRIWYQDSGTRI